MFYLCTYAHACNFVLVFHCYAIFVITMIAIRQECACVCMVLLCGVQVCTCACLWAVFDVGCTKGGLGKDGLFSGSLEE